ncbi:hypothetical protein NQ317_015649 [Molorchus minor]|uniref:Citrate transporter-like domain-containing protein n=1 Tax=Molorchus minor TaxID=1323400 RepID=A0ABQ9JKG1_9CUCU|nr:hypothetical protein NQ317_015649 [Molorchus minor]
MDDGDCDSPRNIIPRRPVTPNVNIEVIPPTPKRKLQRWSNLDALDSVFYNEADTNVKEKPKDNSSYGKGLKHFVLVLIWIICSVALMTNYEKVQDMHQIIVPKNTAKMYEIMKTPFTNKLRVVVDGALLPSYYGNLTTECLSVWVQLLVGKKKASRFDDVSKSDITVRNISDVWVIPVVTERLIGRVPEVEYTNIFDLTSHRTDNTTHSSLRLQFRTNLRANFPISVGYKLQPINPDDGIIYAAVVLTGLYLLIIFDLVHRTLAAMLASTISVAILAALDERPTVQEIVSWIDSETLLLLFSMMTLVTVFSETGVIDHAAVYAYKVFFPENRYLLCDVMNLNPRQILMYTLIAANIGGAITPMGDPPNVIIASNINVVDSGSNFGVFTLHMGVGSLVCLLVAYIQIRYTYRDMAYYKFEGSSTIRGEIAVWKKTAASVGSYSKEEGTVKDNLLLKTEKLSNRLKRTVSSNTSVISEERYSLTLKDLEKQVKEAKIHTTDPGQYLTYLTITRSILAKVRGNRQARLPVTRSVHNV